MVAEVFFRAVAEPDAKGLGDLFFLGFGEAIVELEGAVAFAAAGFVLVGVPVGAGEADAAGGFLDESLAGEVGVVLLVLLGGHGGSCGWADVGKVLLARKRGGEAGRRKSGVDVRRSLCHRSPKIGSYAVGAKFWLSLMPTQTAARPRRTERAMLATAMRGRPSRKDSKVSRLKVEKVVKPPRKPVTRRGKTQAGCFWVK